LLDDGVFQLKKWPASGKCWLERYSRYFNALEYMMLTIFIPKQSLCRNGGLKPGDLCLPVREFYRKDIAGLMKKFDVIFAGSRFQ